ncbi:MAG: transcription termination factor NusA [Eubacteriales bacterium]|nr:transcription termination factor NusA [Eubacteriales bacterium]
MNIEFLSALRALEKERGISADQLFEAIEEALVSAYRREFDIKSADNIRAEIDRDTGEMGVFLLKEVVEEVEDPNLEISLLEAKRMDESFELGDLLELGVSPQDFGRLAAQTAKSVINQKLVGAERERIQQEFSRRVGEIATGVVQRKDKRDVYVDIGRAEAILSRSEQVRSDNYDFNQRMKFYIMKVDDRHGRPQVLLSRSHPALVQKLFEQEVPEIQDGTVEVVHISREAGSRTKISVISRDPNVDALGACVGQRGMRVKAIMDELHGEKIDIINWDPDPVVYIMNSLSPAKVVAVELSEDENEQSATVIVPDHQLSLAIGREGQNARLAARLTGYKIDIISQSAAREEIEQNLLERFDEAAQHIAGEMFAEAELGEEAHEGEDSPLSEASLLARDGHMASLNSKQSAEDFAAAFERAAEALAAQDSESSEADA